MEFLKDRSAIPVVAGAVALAIQFFGGLVAFVLADTPDLRVGMICVFVFLMTVTTGLAALVHSDARRGW